MIGEGGCVHCVIQWNTYSNYKDMLFAPSDYECPYRNALYESACHKAKCCRLGVSLAGQLI